MYYASNLLNSINGLSSSISSVANAASNAASAAADAAKSAKETAVTGGAELPMFASGGLVTYTGLAHLDGSPAKPELVLNPEETENFLTLVNALRNKGAVKSGVGYASIASSLYGGTGVYGNIVGPTDSYRPAPIDYSPKVTNGDVNITVEIDHVQDYNDFVTQLQHDNKFMKVIRDDTIGRLNGGSPFDRYKTRL